MPQMQLATATAIVKHTNIIHYSKSLHWQLSVVNCIRCTTHPAIRLPQNATQAEIWLSALKTHATNIENRKYRCWAVEDTRMWLNRFVWPCTCIPRWHCTSACIFFCCVRVCCGLLMTLRSYCTAISGLCLFVCLFFSCVNFAFLDTFVYVYIYIYIYT